MFVIHYTCVCCSSDAFRIKENSRRWPRLGDLLESVWSSTVHNFIAYDVFFFFFLFLRRTVRNKSHIFQWMDMYTYSDKCSIPVWLWYSPTCFAQCNGLAVFSFRKPCVAGSFLFPADLLEQQYCAFTKNIQDICVYFSFIFLSLDGYGSKAYAGCALGESPRLSRRPTSTQVIRSYHLSPVLRPSPF